MNVEHHNYDSYIKDGAMHSVKATLILSLTTLILFAIYIVYNSNQDRFILLPIQSDKSIYVFDRKANVLNYCTSDNQCKLIKLNLPAGHEAGGSALPASLLSIIDSKNNKGKEGENVVQKPTIQKGTFTVAATQAASVPVTQAKKPALVPADIHASSATPPMASMPLPAAPAAPAMPLPAAPAAPAMPAAPPMVPMPAPPMVSMPAPAPDAPQVTGP